MRSPQTQTDPSGTSASTAVGLQVAVSAGVLAPGTKASHASIAEEAVFCSRSRNGETPKTADGLRIPFLLVENSWWSALMGMHPEQTCQLGRPTDRLAVVHAFHTRSAAALCNQPKFAECRAQERRLYDMMLSSSVIACCRRAVGIITYGSTSTPPCAVPALRTQERILRGPQAAVWRAPLGDSSSVYSGTCLPTARRCDPDCMRQ